MNTNKIILVIISSLFLIQFSSAILWNVNQNVSFTITGTNYWNKTGNFLYTNNPTLDQVCIGQTSCNQKLTVLGGFNFTGMGYFDNAMVVDSVNQLVNVSKLCFFNDSCMTSVPNTTIYYPNSYFTLYGTESGDNNIGNLSYYDSQYFNITEAGGINPLEFYVNFTGVSRVDNIVMRERYTGISGHEIKVQLWDYTTSTWQDYSVITDQAGYVISTTPVLDSGDHVSGGLLQLRFQHQGTGISSHKLSIDFIQLYNGQGVFVNNEHDSLSNRDSPTNHPWAMAYDGWSRDANANGTDLNNLRSITSFNPGILSNISAYFSVSLGYLNPNQSNSSIISSLGSFSLGFINKNSTIQSSSGAFAQGAITGDYSIILSNARGGFSSGYIGSANCTILSSGGFGSFAQGSVNSANSNITSSGDGFLNGGSFAQGSVNNQFSYIKANNSGAFAQGAIIRAGSDPKNNIIISSGFGSFAQGSVIGATSGYENKTILSSGTGSFAQGSITQGLTTNNYLIQSSGTGSFAQGTNNISSKGTGSFAQGSTNIFSLGTGSFAQGLANITSFGTGSFAQGTNNISSNNTGSFAQGSTNIFSLGTGSFAQGYANVTVNGISSFGQGTALLVLQDYSKAIGLNFTNNITQSFMIGYNKPNFFISATDGYFNVTNALSVYNDSGLGKVRASEYATATDVNTKQDVWDNVPTGQDMLNSDGSINHLKFGDCYRKEKITNYSDPHIISAYNLTNEKPTYNEIGDINGSITTYETHYNIEYGYYYVDMMSIGCEVAKQDQRDALLAKSAKPIKLSDNTSALDGNTALFDRILTKSKVINPLVDYTSKFKNKSDYTIKEKNPSYTPIFLANGTKIGTLDMESRIVNIEGFATDEMACLQLYSKWDDYRLCMLGGLPKK